MPRIRTLKPEHKQHRKIGPLSDREYRVWVGLVTEADDDGRLVADPAQLRALIFPYHPRVQTSHVASALEHLALVGLIRLYSVNGTRYAYLPSWRDHQKLDRAHYLPSRLPVPTESNTYHAVDSQESIGRLSVDSSESTSSQGREPNYSGNLKAHGTEGSTRETTSGQQADPDSDSPHALLAWLNTKAGTNYRPVPANLDLIRARLTDGILPWQLRAIVSRKVREWGPDPKMQKFLRPATLFGKTKCEQYLGELPAVRPPE